MALTPYVLNDPFFNNIERAMDRAFDRAIGQGGRGGDIMGAFMPSLTGPSSAGGHPMVSISADASLLFVRDAVWHVQLVITNCLCQTVKF